MATIRRTRLSFRFSRGREPSRRLRLKLQKNVEKAKSKSLRIFPKRSISKERSQKIQSYPRAFSVRKTFKFPTFPLRLSLRISKSRGKSILIKSRIHKAKAKEPTRKSILAIRKNQFTAGYLITDWLGENARQDAEAIYISKSDLALLGLTPKPENSVEEIFLSLIQLWIAQPESQLFNVSFYRYITLNQENIIFQKQSYLIRLLLPYNSQMKFP